MPSDTQGILADRVLRRRACHIRCPIEAPPVRNRTIGCFKLVASGNKRVLAKNKANFKIHYYLQLLTGVYLTPRPCTIGNFTQYIRPSMRRNLSCRGHDLHNPERTARSLPTVTVRWVEVHVVVHPDIRRGVVAREELCGNADAHFQRSLCTVGSFDIHVALCLGKTSFHVFFPARMATFMCTVIEAERTDSPHLCDARSVSRSCGKDHPRGHGRQALCDTAYEGNGSFIVHSKVSPVKRLTTRLYFKRVARGREPSCSKKQE